MYFSQLISCSIDKTLGLWDVQSGTRIRKYRGHQTYVNSCGIARRGPQLMCSGSDDGTIKVGVKIFIINTTPPPKKKRRN